MCLPPSPLPCLTDSDLTGVVVTFVTFAVYSSIPGNKMTSDVVFPSIALFNFLQVPLSAAPMFLLCLIQVAIADKRISAFLGIKESNSKYSKSIKNCRKSGERLCKHERGNVHISGDFSWETLVSERFPNYPLQQDSIREMSDIDHVQPSMTHSLDR